MASVIAPAMAQEAAIAPGGEPYSTSEITVTGSRVYDGRASTVPVSVLGERDIAAQNPANLIDLLAQLPAITPGSTPGNSSGNMSNGLAGIAAVNLRGLGTMRTLVLIDGQRTVGAAINGVVDINTIPQALVRRVEVVTGGASAQYGSDAIGGVVNFILDTDRRGTEVKLDQGLSTYGDGAYRRVGITSGLSLLDGRIRILLSGEYFDQDGVDTIARPWNARGYFQINNPAYTPANGQPQRIVGTGVAPATYAPGGLVTSGPLQGTQFLGAGATTTLRYGQYAPAIGAWMVGGDTSSTLAGHVGTNALIPQEHRISLFQRTTVDLGGGTSLAIEGAWNRYAGESAYQQTPSTGVTIAADNAYLRAQYPQIAARMDSLGLRSLSIGTSNAGFPVPGSSNRRDVFRLSGTLHGDVALLDGRFQWDVHAQHGKTSARERLRNVWNLQRMQLAQDAVATANGPVCRSTLTDPANGCIPIDRLGTEDPSGAALAYVMGPGQPERTERLTQDLVNMRLQGPLFALPGGNAVLAAGAEWRRDAISSQVADPYRSGWLYGNYQPAHGSSNVGEAYLELGLPILSSVRIDGAARLARYATSGWVGTWKLGAAWEPLPGVRLRGNVSRDVRAPNLADLYAGTTSRTNSVVLPANAPAAGTVSIVELTLPNAELKPERARSWTAGMAFAPRFIEGLTASVDYFAISIRDAIGAATAQQTVDLCYSGASVYCGNLVSTGGVPTSVLVRPVNFARQSERGIDFHASYAIPLAHIARSLPGEFRVDGAATHYIDNIVDNGIYPVDYAGVNGDSTFNSPAVPSWVFRASAFWTVDPVSFNLVARGFGSGVYSNSYVSCTSGCPASTAQHRTINDNRISGITYLDASVRVDFGGPGRERSLTLAVTDLLDKAPVPVGNGPDGNNWPAYAQTNRLLYDVVGRVFRLTMRIGF
ncbi:outer membrane receptor protein involved in Fe transport [Sphingomonas trueperi]|uniref:TonB-dependent receptor plug domain-containing protein n=1 Tax=Sphingomonas trueperi TaxID=53317 RepID=UPI003399BA7E